MFFRTTKCVNPSGFLCFGLKMPKPEIDINHQILPSTCAFKEHYFCVKLSLKLGKTYSITSNSHEPSTTFHDFFYKSFGFCSHFLRSCTSLRYLTLQCPSYQRFPMNKWFATEQKRGWVTKKWTKNARKPLSSFFIAETVSHMKKIVLSLGIEYVFLLPSSTIMINWY